MAAKDGSTSFDFNGIYTNIKEFEKINYEMTDGRKVEIFFKETDGKTEVIETFDPENENPGEMQKTGWQSIIDLFPNSKKLFRFLKYEFLSKIPAIFRREVS